MFSSTLHMLIIKILTVIKSGFSTNGPVCYSFQSSLVHVPHSSGKQEFISTVQWMLADDTSELFCSCRGLQNKCLTFDVLIKFFTWHVTDTEVSCVFMESCILPCSFQGGKDVVVHWILVTEGHLHVHSYYHNQDQLALQDQSLRGRTSLFKDQISG